MDGRWGQQKNLYFGCYLSKSKEFFLSWNGHFISREKWNGHFIFRETWSRPPLYHPQYTSSNKLTELWVEIKQESTPLCVWMRSQAEITDAISGQVSRHHFPPPLPIIRTITNLHLHDESYNLFLPFPFYNGRDFSTDVHKSLDYTFFTQMT